MVFRLGKRILYRGKDGDVMTGGKTSSYRR